ncbi:MAG: hypothetical protein QOC82_3722 [Frankiaceae bacterium]|jgi:transposase-like protein|nr:hypothetical protein [Frankiaceae bacterium]
MPIRKDGREVNTVADAAQHFGVSAKTVDKWIRAGVIPEPPVMEYGLGVIRTYPPDYLKRADKALREARAKRSQDRQRVRP